MRRGAHCRWPTPPPTTSESRDSERMGVMWAPPLALLPAAAVGRRHLATEGPQLASKQLLAKLGHLLATPEQLLAKLDLAALQQVVAVPNHPS